MELPEARDAYGFEVWHHLKGESSAEIVERSDGYIATSGGPQTYFAPFRRWPAPERRAVRWVRGRVLDVGCGAGRVALELQRRGHAVTGIDISPKAVETARARGVSDARVVAIEDVSQELGEFDTIVMFGNNFGLFGTPRRLKRLLGVFGRMTTPAGRIVATSNDPSATDDADHLAYQQANRAAGRMPGQLRLRVRHRRLATPWFDYLIVSPAEMGEVLRGTGWHVTRLIPGDTAYYAAVLEKRG
jgi:SAM-dependent methyltransferase